jgi:5-methylcytosine-specific restriction endonuclease McrA
MTSTFTLEEYERKPSVLYGPFGGARRRKPPKRIQAAIVAEYGWRCRYCSRPVGRNAQLPAEWDHFIPYSYGHDNPDDNWVLACRACNAIKGAKMFESITEAREYIQRFI